ncbi:MAG: M12 family metallo-peptidase [Steroidobacteraceae bacterium]
MSTLRTTLYTLSQLPLWLVALGAMFVGTGYAAQPSALRIHRFVSIDDPTEMERKHVNSTSSGHTSRLTQLNIFGKQLKFSLQDNQQLLESLPGSITTPRLLRGQLQDNDRSWIRLTHTNDGTHGLIWDGSELYVVEPSNSVRSALTAAAGQPSTDTVIFRLSDTEIDLGTEYCGSDDADTQSTATGTPTGLATYQTLTDELQDQPHTTGTPTLRLEMQVLADAAFRAQFASDQEALDAVLVRMNNIDGIFSDQLSLQVQATDIQIYANDPRQLGNSNNASTLLTALGQLRNSSALMRSYAITHLFTGRDLDGDTMGIAYIGKVCNSRYGVSLSEIRNRGAWIDSLVAAHELGHQLGAVHDGTEACASTAASGHLMDASINGSSIFSLCSQDSIRATINVAACLVPINSVDLFGEPASFTATDKNSDSTSGGGSITPAWLCLLLLGVLRRKFRIAC